jgi:hypothetical protein
MDSNSYGWIGLCGFLLVMLLIMTIFYSYILTTRIDPTSCPKSIGNYGVIAGKIGAVLNNCDTRDEFGGRCEFIVPSLFNATTKCDSDSRCQAFYYDGIRMIYIDPNSPMVSVIPGGSYIRQRDIIS